MANDILVRIGADISQFSRNMNAATKRMSAFGRMANSSSGLTVGKLGAIGGAALALHTTMRTLRSGVEKAFTRIDTMEQFERVMTTMLDPSEDVNDILNTINDTVTGTAYGLDDGARAVQRFVTSGVDVHKATDAIAAWGDSVAFYGDGSVATYNTVVDALSKMNTKGSVQMEELNRITEAGIPALDIYADATGQSVDEVAKQMQAGELDASEFMDTMTEALSEGTDNFKAIDGAAKNAGASWGATFTNMQAAVARGIASIITSIDEVLMSNGLPDLRTMFAELGEKAEESLKKIAESVTPIVQKLIDFKTALEPHAGLIKGVATAVGIFVGAMAALGSVMMVVNAIMMINPFTAIAAAIVTAAALIYIYWEPISEFFVNLWEGIKESGLAIWETLSEIWQTAVESLMELFTPVVEFFTGMWQGVTDATSEAWQGITEALTTVWEGILTLAEGMWELIKLAILGPILLLINLATGDMEEFSTNLSQIWTDIKEAASQIWQGLVSVVSGIISGLVSAVTGFISGLASVLSGLWNGIKSVASAIWNGLVAAVTGIVNGFIAGVTGLINGFSATLSGIWNGISSAASTIWNGMVDAVTGIVDGLIDGLTTAWESAKDLTSEAFEAVVGFIEDPLGEVDLLQIGKDIVQGLINGIKSKVAAVGEAITEVTGKITGKVKSILGIKSPSRVLMRLGEYTGEGLEKGIASMEGRVGNAAAGLADAATPRLSMDYATPSGVRSSLSSAVNGTVDVNGGSMLSALNDIKTELRNQKQMIVELDGERVGRAVTPHVNGTNALDNKGRYF